MSHRASVPALALAVGAGLVLSALTPARDATATPPPERVVPGLTRTGFVQLPNGWRLRPYGAQLEVGDFPVNSALHPSGTFLAVLHAGYRDHEVVILNVAAAAPRVVSRVVVPQTYLGIAFSPDGTHLYASGGEYELIHEWAFDAGLLGKPRAIPVADPKTKFIPGQFAVSADGETLYVPGTWGNAVVVAAVNDPKKRGVVPLGPTGQALPGERTGPTFRDNETSAAPAGGGREQCFPYACLPSKDGKRLFTSLWSKAAVAVIDLDRLAVTATWATERHPTEMALSPDGQTLYVACSNSTKVTALDTATGAARETIHCALHPTTPSGNTPNSLCLSPDGKLLFVACADANNLAVVNVSEPGKAAPMGFVPTGWYPTSVRYNAKTERLHVTNGKGATSRANRHGPNPLAPNLGTVEYIASLLRGTVGTFDLPSPPQLAKATQTAFACCPLKADATPALDAPPGNPVPARVGMPSPIKYVVYVVKENRTYDQVFGDLPQGNGDASLCLFPRGVTPNHHKLAEEFVLLDNTYVDGEVSADGHEWSMGAYATDFVEKNWPLSYRGSPMKKLGYPAEGAYDEAARPAGGYLWDKCAEAGVTYRSYGEWVENGNKPGEPARASVKALEGHFDPGFRSYDLEYPDVKRAERFLSEVRRFERDGGMPQLSIVRLPNDHTYASRVGKPTPTAMVAENDLALGQLVEGFSKTTFWKESAIFVIEDDAQNGPDHVDAHRVVSLVVSPYCKRGSVDSTMYSTSSLLRTMELILGVKPMSQFDAAARPMYASFRSSPDARPYTHEVPKVDFNARNERLAWGAALSETFDLTKEDRADDLLLNQVIWRSVRGSGSAMPAPVRAVFYRPGKSIQGRPLDDDDD